MNQAIRILNNYHRIGQCSKVKVLRAVLLLVTLSVVCSRAVLQAGWTRTVSCNIGLRELRRQNIARWWI